MMLTALEDISKNHSPKNQKNMTIPFINLDRQHKNLSKEIQRAIERVANNSSFILGNEVLEFEREFSSFIGTKYAVGVANASDAITLTLKAYDIGHGNEVITAAHGAFMTVESIINTGAEVKFVDIDPRTYNIDPDDISKAINPSTKAIIPVHLYGQPANMTAIKRITEDHKLLLIEDASQAHGAFIDFRRVGTIGNAGVFSFFPSKNLGGWGDGGMVVTNNEHIAQKIKMLRDHGRSDKYTHKIIGRNSRLDALQAAILAVKLPHLDQWNARRREIAHRYNNGLKGLPLILPEETQGGKHVYHLYVIRLKMRDALKQYLEKHAIQTGLHYPIALHKQPAYSRPIKQEESFPVAEACAEEVLSLPCFPELRNEEVDFVVKKIHEWHT